MLRTAGQRIAVIVTAMFALITVAVLINSSVIRKPWGVRDSERSTYDQLLSKHDNYALISQQVKGIDRPIVQLNPFFSVGFVRPQTPIDSKIRVDNKGQMPLSLTLVQDHFHGLSVEATDQPIPPGQHGFIKLQGSAEQFVDDQSTIELLTNDPLRKSVTLSLEAKIATPLTTPAKITAPVHDPGRETTVEFIVSSQIYKDFEIVDVIADDDSLISTFDRVDVQQLGRQYEESFEGVLSAWQVTASVTRFDYGKYEIPLTITVQTPDGNQKTKTVLQGRVRSPIAFFSPEMNRFTGLNIDTIRSDQRHDHFVIVKLRSEQHRTLAILEHEPEPLDVELTRSSSGNDYRLRITVPQDCPPLLFNREGSKGFIKVGDPNNPDFFSWFYLTGAVVNLNSES